MRAAVALCALALVGFGAFASSAGAAELHLFDPALSLTGDCSTSAVDEVPDPGLCPMPPGVAGVDHPATPFRQPKAVATDSYGDVYVASFGSGEGENGVIDVFDPSGHFLTEVADAVGLQSVAVDSKGYLYVSEWHPGYRALHRYKPEPYEPQASPPQIAYPNPPVLVTEEVPPGGGNLAVNPADDHLFVNREVYVEELTSAEEGNEPVGRIAEGMLHGGQGIAIAIDHAHNRLYVNGNEEAGAHRPVIYAFELEAPHNLVLTIDGSNAPPGEWHTKPTVAANEGTGAFYVFDGGERSTEAIYEFDQAGDYRQTIEYAGISNEGGTAKLTVDNGAQSPNGALNPTGRYIYLPTVKGGGSGHSLAFEASEKCAPQAKELSVAHVTDADAQLRGAVNPCGDETTWSLQYTSRQRFEAEGFEGASTAASGTLGASKADQAVSGLAAGLAPATAYRFRLVVANSIARDEAEGSFATYPAPLPWAPCPNDTLRTGPSAALPDCRAYELVSPADTNGHAPVGLGNLGIYFPTVQSSPDGESVSFQIDGGAIPGYDVTGSLAGDPYLATRTPAGWRTESAGPDGGEASTILPGSPSPDQGYSFWQAEGAGSALVEEKTTDYIRYPDGHSELLGRGSIGTNIHASGDFISEGGTHVLFSSGVQLEPDGAPDGTGAIYDRAPGGALRVVSLLPGDVTPAAGQGAGYRAASPNGQGVAFEVGAQLYLRYRDEVTYPIGEGAATFEGLSEGARRTFYLQGGDLKAFDAQTGQTTRFTESGDVTPVNVSAGGTSAYFVSPSVLAGANPHGDSPVEGEENLYLSREGQIAFVGTVTERDVEGEGGGGGGVATGGLGLWGVAVSNGIPAIDPSRATADGAVLLFESRANLTGYDPEGHSEVYRYSSAEGTLTCLSCDPTGAAPQGDADLQSVGEHPEQGRPLNPSDMAGNLRAGGRRAFFESPDPLVLGDRDGLLDVYEWEAEGLGSCRSTGGCLYLISSGQSTRPDYLFATGEGGRDVFIRSSDLLAPALDPDETASIYDARAEGGFPPPSAGAAECLGEACQPALAAPEAPTPPTAASHGAGNLPTPRRPCTRGKRRVRRHGRSVCRKLHRRRHHPRHRRHRGARHGKGASR